MLYGPAVGACSRTLQWEHALLLVHRLWAKTLTPDTTMMNVVITVCERSGHWAWSLQLLKQSRDNGPSADRTTCNAVINACATGSCWETALQLLQTADAVDGDGDAGDGARDVALGSALRACSLARRWEEALQLPRRNLVAHFALLDACSGFAWLPTPQLTEETRISLASKGGGDHGKTIMAAVTEQLQDLNAFGDHEVALLHAFQTPVTRRLLALTRSVPLCVMDLGGEVVLRDRLLERQSSLGPFFVEDFLSQIGCDPLKAFLEEARAKSRRSMEGTMISGDPMAKDIVTYVASTLGALPGVFCGGRRWVGGYRAESWKALPALYVEHHRFPHAERQALLDLLAFAKRMTEMTEEN